MEVMATVRSSQDWTYSSKLQAAPDRQAPAARQWVIFAGEKWRGIDCSRRNWYSEFNETLRESRAHRIVRDQAFGFSSEEVEASNMWMFLGGTFEPAPVWSPHKISSIGFRMVIFSVLERARERVRA